MDTTTPRPSGRRGIRRLLTAAAVLMTAVVLALIGTGTSYALWNGRADVNASTVSAGSTGLAINGVSAYALTGLDVTRLAPGRSVFAPLTVSNTGTTKLAVTVATTTVTQTLAIADELTIVLTPVASAAACTAGLTGGMSSRMNGFSTTAMPFAMAPGSSLQVCLEVILDADAPAGVQGGTAAFTMNLAGLQVR